MLGKEWRIPLPLPPVPVTWFQQQVVHLTRTSPLLLLRDTLPSTSTPPQQSEPQFSGTLLQATAEMISDFSLCSPLFPGTRGASCNLPTPFSPRIPTWPFSSQLADQQFIIFCLLMLPEILTDIPLVLYRGN